MTKEEIVDQICNDLSGAGWNLFQGEAEKKQVAEHLARLRYRREDTIVLRCNEDGKWDTYEPYATIECPDKGDYDFIVRAVEHYKQSRESGNMVEIVRCKDCALRYTGDCASMHEDDSDMYFRLCDDDEFCSSGVKKGQT